MAMAPSRVLPTPDDVAAAARRIAGHVLETPVFRHPALDAAAGATVLVKAECLQLTGSFKIRGATNRLAQIAPGTAPGGVVAFSSGNHAQGVARAARRLGLAAEIVMPADVPAVKRDGVRGDGAAIRTYDRETESREAIAEALAAERGAVLVPSYDDPDIVAGQGTAGLEFARQADAMGGPLDALICCTGGGGLIAGITLALEATSPATRIWTAEPDGHDDWARSLAAGMPVSNAPGTRSICDAILTPTPGRIPWAVMKDRLAGGLSVSDGEVREAIRFAFRHLKLVLEPGGAVALAAALRGLGPDLAGGRVGLVLSGGNVDPQAYAAILSQS